MDDSGTNFSGKGRGFTPFDLDNSDDRNGFGGGGRGRGMSNFDDKKNGFGRNNKENDDGFKPTESFGDDDGGFKPTYDRDDQDDGGRGRGRGRGRGGRGGGRGRRDDDDGGYKSYDRNDRKDDGFGGGFDGERRGGRGRGGRGGGGGGYRRNDDDGGYKSFDRDNRSDDFGGGNEDGERRGGRGRGGRGGGGGYRRNDDDGGYKPFDRDNRSDDFGGDNEDGGRGRGRGRGRGGRGGRGGNRDRDDGNDFNDGDNRRDGDGEDGEKKEFINKEIYIPPEPEQDEDVLFATGISAGINFSKFSDIQVKVSEGMPPPISKFEDAGLRPFVVENVKKCKYETPSPVQKYGIPIIMKGYDVMACAQTGSGKTAAFAIPIINSLLSDPKDLVCHGEHCEPQCLVIAPTRELVIQIGDEFRKFANSSILKIETAYGGTAVGYQAKRLLSGCHIIVATPGRLKDYITRGRIQLGSIRFLVLDEADRMLETGFLGDMETVVDHETMVPKDQRQTLMFSATFPEAIQKLAGRFLKEDYSFITVGIVGGANTDVEQNFYQVSHKEKKPKLIEILERERENKSLAGTIIFVETKKTADFLAAYLSENNYPTTSMHGDRLQSQREQALRDLKLNKMDILVATNVGARGLDIKGVVHVIQYDIGKEIDMYVHRIGRTGRVGNKGRATTFYNPEQDSAIAGELVRILKQAGQSVPDFLEGAGSGDGNYQPGKSSNFGARDFRQGGAKGSDDFNNAAEPEEAW